MLVIPVCLTRTFGTMVGNRRQGIVLLAVMGVLWAGAARGRLVRGDATRRPGGAGRRRGDGGQGDPVRDPGVGAVRGVHHRHVHRRGQLAARQLHRRCGGGVMLLNMLLGEIAPGGVGSGLYGMLVLAVIAVFVAGLMVGRTPEYLGKKLGGARDHRSPRCRCWSCRRWCCSAPGSRSPCPARLRRAEQRRRRTASPRCCTRSRRRRTTTAARSPADRDQRLLPVRARRSRCCSAGSCRSSRCSRWPARWPRSSRVDPAPARCRPTGAAVRRARRRHRRAGRGADLLPGPRAGPASRRHWHDHHRRHRRPPDGRRRDRPRPVAGRRVRPAPAVDGAARTRCASSTRAASCATR